MPHFLELPCILRLTTEHWKKVFTLFKRNQIQNRLIIFTMRIQIMPEKKIFRCHFSIFFRSSFIIILNKCLIFNKKYIFKIFALNNILITSTKELKSVLLYIKSLYSNNKFHHVIIMFWYTLAVGKCIDQLLKDQDKIWTNDNLSKECWTVTNSYKS